MECATKTGLFSIVRQISVRCSYRRQTVGRSYPRQPADDALASEATSAISRTPLRSRMVWCILLLAFLLRLCAATYWHRQAAAEDRLFRLGDSESYWVLAGHLARGEPYQYGGEDARIFRAPLLPMVLAPLTYIPDGRTAVWWARVLASALGVVAIFELMVLARRLGGDTAAAAAGLLAAVSPAAIGMSVVVLSEMLLLPLMIAHLLLWQNAWLAANPKRMACMATLAGMVAGAAVLARPSWLLFAPFLFGLAFLFGPNRWRHAHIFAYTILGLCVVMSPWWIRNARVTGKFVLTTLQVGPSLYDGLHPGATGASDEGMAFTQRMFAEQIEADRLSPKPPVSTLEYRVNRRAQMQAIDFARDNPGEVLRLAVAKFYRTWSIWPDGGEIGSTPIRLAVTVGTFSILLLAIYGTWVIRPQGWIGAICWVPCLYFTLLHMVFVGSIRYREPAVFILAALAGCAIAKMARRSVSRNDCVTGQHGSLSNPSNGSEK